MISDINKLELDVKWQNLTPGCTIVGSCTAEVFRTEERLSPGHRMCAGCIHTLHGKILLFIMLSKMPEQPAVE